MIMEEQQKPESIRAIIADIRNKMGPLYNLAQMTREWCPNNTEITRILRREAMSAIESEKIIREQLLKLEETDEQILIGIEQDVDRYRKQITAHEESYPDSLDIQDIKEAHYYKGLRDYGQKMIEKLK